MSDPTGLTPRQQVLLMFLAGGDASLDPIRIMKGMFLFSQECPVRWLGTDSRYEFEPYNWGPFSGDVYRDLDALVERGLATTTRVAGRSWSYHSATPAGLKVARALGPSFAPGVSVYLRRLREFVLSIGFSELLKSVYSKYPQYAVNSVFRQ